MKKRDYFYLCALEKFCFVFSKFLPVVGKKILFRPLKKLFEKLAIQSYLRDRKDIGFFESFILGSEETRRLSLETQLQMQKIKSANIKRQALLHQLDGYVTDRHADERQDEQEQLEHYIYSKKLKVVDMLTERDEIIKYLGRRIVTDNEKLYQKLEKLYNFLNTNITA